MFKKIYYTLIVTLLLPFSWNIEAQNQEKPVPMDHRVKAAFLVKFIKYIEWPSSNYPGEIGRFKLGVFGESPIAGNLFSIMPKAINGWQLEIIKIRTVEECLDTHMLFLSSSEIDQYAEIINALKDSSVLTVSDTKDFLDMGGMINFLIVDEMVRFEINLKAAEKSGLKISSRILKLARSVYKQ